MIKKNIRLKAFTMMLSLFFLGMSFKASFAQDLPENSEFTRSFEEILVVARHREENVQQIPVSITVINSEGMRLRNIENIKNLQLLIPNVDIRGDARLGGASGSFAIRGVKGVTRYIDGVHLTGEQGSLLNIVEIDRIEILRGPQGTYFGKNAMGGVMHYITKRPSDEYSLNLRAIYGSFDRRDLIANINIPLSENTKAKITAGKLYRGGYVESTTIDQSYGEQSNYSFRGVLDWSPTDNLNILFAATSNTEKSDMQAYVLFDVIEDFPFGPRAPESYNNPSLSNYPFTDELYAFGKDKKYLSASDYRGVGVDFKSFDISATLNWDISSSMSLRSITSAREFHSGVWQDSDATPLGFYNAWSYDEVQEVSQEFHIAGVRGSLEWLAGLFFQNVASTEVDTSWQRIELTGSGSQGPRINNSLVRNEVRDAALYGEIVYSFTDDLLFTLGARFSREQIKNTIFTPLQAVTAADMSSPNYHTEGVVAQIDGVPLVGRANFDAITGRLAVQYQITEDIMIYSGVSEGFNAGGVNSIFDPSLPGNGVLPYSGESLTNYELGFRSEFFGDILNLNATAFWGRWHDFQISETLIPGLTIITNGGAVKTSGFELEGRWAISEAISADFSVGALSTAYVDIGSASSISLDTPIPFAPEHSFSLGFQWDKDLNTGANLTTRIDWGWISDYETSGEKVFQTTVGVNEAYGLLGARAEYLSPSGNFTLALFGTNLTNEWYRLGGFAATLSGIDQGVVARPREFGVSLTIMY